MKKFRDAIAVILLAVSSVQLLLCPLCVLSEKVGPAIVFKNDARQTTSDRVDVIVRKPVGPTSTHARTTTVYGFLDFTTTIDNTVVVFRPSSASTAAVMSSSGGSSSVVAGSSNSDDRRLHPNIRPTKTRQMPTVSVNSDRRGLDDKHPSRTRVAGPAIVMLGRTDVATPTIAPTPTLRSRGTTPSSKQGDMSDSTSSRRLVNSSSLSEKRRRFLALARRHRPTIKPKVVADVDEPVTPESDQEMAESIERTPNKVKRMYQAIQTSTSGNISGGRILIRKLQRRLGGQTRSDKNRQVLALRRPSSKLNLLTASGSNPEEDFDEKEDQRSFLMKNGPLELASSFDSTSSSGRVTSNVPSSRGVGSDVTEYHELYHDVTEYLGTESKATALQSSLMSPLNTADEHDSSAKNGLHGRATSRETSIVATSADPLVKTSVRLGPTVPLQLSIVTSMYSTTETRLRTSLLPVYDGKSTTFYTLTHSFVVTKTVSTFQTVPPEEYMHYLIPGNNESDDDSLDALNDVLESYRRPTSSSSASELQRKVDDLDTDDAELQDQKKKEKEKENEDEDEEDEASPDELLEKAGSIHADVEKVESTSNNPASPIQPAIGQPGAVNPALLGNLPFLNLLGPAAALGLNPYFPYGFGIPQVLTTSRPVFSTDVIYTSKLVPIIDGLTTAYRTLQEAASTVTRTSYETYVTTTGNAPGNVGGLMGGHAGLPGGGGGGVSIITQPHTFVTTETQVETQVFKLMYDGYKTSYRTVSSSQLITRTVTTHTTTTVPIYNTMQLPFFG